MVVVSKYVKNKVMDEARYTAKQTAKMIGFS